MEEIDAFLEQDDSIPPGIDGIYDSEGDTLYLEELLSVINSDLNLPPLPICEIKVPEKIKSSCEDPPDLELKDLPSHLEYAFLEGDDKLPVIIAKNLKDEDKTSLIKVLKSHKHVMISVFGDSCHDLVPMSRMQLNSKFVNNMLPEWGRFVTAVKLNRGLRDSNYDQLYAYLKQHEAHANENKMMLDQFTQHSVDPLALMSNVSQQQYYSQLSTTPPSTHLQPHFADDTQLDSGLSSMDNLIENLTNTLALLTQSYKTYLPQTNNQLRTTSNIKNQAIVQDGRVVVQNVQVRQNRGQGNNAWGAGASGYGGAQNRVGNANSGQARQIKCYNCNKICHIARNCTQPKQPQNSEYFKDKMLLMQTQENEVALDEEQLLFIAGRQDNVVDEDVDEQLVQDLALNVDNVFQADDCDAFDFDVDEASTAQTMF
ncbi:retrovirus-related pol polyprotein from transposon TNT 1-94, partial [Tanacetum coccineum]